MSIAYEGVVAVGSGAWSLDLPANPYSTSWDVPFANQVNGLLDASVRRQLRVVTGTVRGEVPVVVEVLSREPDDPAENADVVEASIWAPEGIVELHDGMNVAVARIAVGGEGPVRVRYTLTGLDAGRRQQIVRPGDVAPDRCLLQLWPAPVSPDEVLRVASVLAAGWHAAVAAAPHVLTDDEQAELDRIEQARRDVEFEEQTRRDELESWGGRLPGPRVASAGWALDVLAHPDRDLLDVIEVLPDDDCRRVATAVVSSLVARSHLADHVPSVSAALDDLDAGRAPRAPFRSAAEALEAAGGPPAPPPPVLPEFDGGAGLFVSVAGTAAVRSTTPVQETAMAVAAVAGAGTGWEALWCAVQSARDVVDRATLAATVRAALPRK